MAVWISLAGDLVPVFIHNSAIVPGVYNDVNSILSRAAARGIIQRVCGIVPRQHGRYRRR